MHELCSDTHLRDSYGKDRSKKFFWDLDGKKYRIGNAYSYTVNKAYSDLCMWMTSNWLETNKILIR